MILYYWMTFAVSFVCLLYVPSEDDAMDNIGASFFVALSGFILWLIFVVAAYKTLMKNKENDHG